RPETGHRPAVRTRPYGCGPERPEPAPIPRADAARAGRRLGRVRARRPAGHLCPRPATDRARAGRRRVADYASLPIARLRAARLRGRSEEHTSELQSLAYLVCRLLL